MVHTPLLYYVYDPMCSWCWGFHPVWQDLSCKIESHINIQYVLGGLAPDTDQPMQKEMQNMLQGVWRQIEQLNNTQFNHDFWENNIPRRSTYPACRAMLVARKHQCESEMLLAIQQAYYLQARNPSDDDTLIDIAEKLGINRDTFINDFYSATIQNELMYEIKSARMLKLNTFPGLLLFSNHMESFNIEINYHSADIILSQIKKIIESG